MMQGDKTMFGLGQLAWVWISLGTTVGLFAATYLLGLRHIPNNRVGIVEKLWSIKGSIRDGRIIALAGEAGYQVDMLRGGLHFFYWPWQYRVHRLPLVSIPQGKIGYVYARDGVALVPEQTLASVVPCNNFQNSRQFLVGDDTGSSIAGQRGRQRAILREGVYAINLAVFVVITEGQVFQYSLNSQHELGMIRDWQQSLSDAYGFEPIVIGKKIDVPLAEVVETSAGKKGQEKADDETTNGKPPENDVIGVVVVHDGPALEPGDIIAPAVATSPSDLDYHSNYQDPEAFLRAGGRRGRQYVPLTDGTYFINRWFATVEVIPKTVVPIGHVGVVVSYYGNKGHDVSGDGFRHGERVAEDERGVREKPLGPGKYAFNTYSGRMYAVPTTNFVLHWITGRTETHRYDESLKSIDLVTADAYEPVLPLSVVVHIDYQKASSVTQRFGDVKKLITQTLDPLLSAYFRDIAHTKSMLQLLHERDMIQKEARETLKRRFLGFDIELVDVLIGKPQTNEASGEIETLLEQLRLRQLSRERIVTYEQQQAAAEKLKDLKLAEAVADKQTELTNSRVEIEITRNRGDADLAMAHKQADQTVVTAEAEKKRRLLLAESEGQAKKLVGEGESQRITKEGEAEANVLHKKIASYGDPKLYAMSLVARYLSRSKQPLVPERLFVSENGQNGHPGQGQLGRLLDLLVAGESGFDFAGEEIEEDSAATSRPSVTTRVKEAMKTAAPESRKAG